MMNEDKFSLMGSELTDEQASTDYKSDALITVSRQPLMN